MTIPVLIKANQQTIQDDTTTIITLLSLKIEPLVIL